jgi:hypothetical protein
MLYTLRYCIGIIYLSYACSIWAVKLSWLYKYLLRTVTDRNITFLVPLFPFSLSERKSTKGKDKQRSTKHTHKGKRSSNTNPTKNLGWIQIYFLRYCFIVFVRLCHFLINYWEVLSYEHLLYFFFRPFCCLFFFDIRILITPFGISKLFLSDISFRSSKHYDIYEPH